MSDNNPFFDPGYAEFLKEQEEFRDEYFKMANPYAQMAEIQADWVGQPSPVTSAKASLKDTELRLNWDGMKAGAIATIAKQVQGGMSTAATIIDGLLVPMSVVGEGVATAAQMIAPPDSALGGKLKKAYGAFAAQTYATGNPIDAGALGLQVLASELELTDLVDPEQVGRHFLAPVGTSFEKIQANPEQAFAEAAGLVNQLVTNFQDPEKVGGVVGRLAALEQAGGPDMLVGSAMAKEFFGLAPIPGADAVADFMEGGTYEPKRKGVTGALREKLDLPKVEAGVFDLLARRVQGERGRFMSDVPDDFYRVDATSLHTGPIPTIKMKWGKFEYEGPTFSGVGFSEDGAGWFTFRKENALFNPSFDGYVDFTSEVLFDPLTYVGAGAAGKVMGRPLSKEGVRRFGGLVNQVQAERKAMRRGAETTEELEGMIKKFAEDPDELVASRILLEEARRDTGLLAKGGEVRWMGQRLGSFRGGYEKMADFLRVEDTMAAWNRALLHPSNNVWVQKTKNGLKYTQESLSDAANFGRGLARRVGDVFSPDLTKNAEFLSARVIAQGMVAETIEPVRARLGLAKLTDIQNKQVFDMISDPHTPANTADLGGDARRVVQEARLLDAEYEGLAQAATTGIDLDVATRWGNYLRLNGQPSLAAVIDRRVAQAGAAGMKKMPRTELFFNNTDKQMKRYTGQVAAMFYPGHQRIDALLADMSQQFKNGRKPLHNITGKTRKISDTVKETTYTLPESQGGIDVGTVRLRGDLVESIEVEEGLRRQGYGSQMLHDAMRMGARQAQIGSEDARSLFASAGWDIAPGQGVGNYSAVLTRAGEKGRVVIKPKMYADADAAAIQAQLLSAYEEGGARGMKEMAVRMKADMAEVGELLIGKGDRGAVITPLSMTEFRKLGAELEKAGHRMPALRPVLEAQEYVLRRAQNVAQKKSMSYLLKKVVHMSGNDLFARNTIEAGLTPVGAMERHPNVVLERVNNALDLYVEGRRNVVERGGLPAEPMQKAWGKLKTREEKELFIRKWFFNEAGEDLGWNAGDTSMRWYQMANFLGSNLYYKKGAQWGADFAPPETLKGKALTKWWRANEQWNAELKELQELLNKEGIDNVFDVLRPAYRFGEKYNGMHIAPLRRIQRMDIHGKDPYYRFTGPNNKGEPLFLPTTFSAQLERMSDAALANPEAAALVKGWMAFTNFAKLSLTAVGGFPSFQLRNLYSNIAFGMTGSHIHLLNQPNFNRMLRLTANNFDPALAVTQGGYQRSLRVQAMQSLSTDITHATVLEADVRPLVRDLYSRGEGVRKAGKAHDTVKFQGLLDREVKRIRDELNTVVMQTDNGLTYTMKEVLHHLRRQGVEIDPRTLNELADIGSTFRNRAGNKWGKLLQAALDGKDRNLNRLLQLNTFFEQWSRQQVFLASLSQGIGAEAAGLQAKKWLLDYQALSPFERSFMKNVIPFYTFYRRSLPLMVESLFTRPGQNALMAKVLTDPGQPAFSYETTTGETIALSQDGGHLQILTGIDVPLVQSTKFLDVGYYALGTAAGLAGKNPTAAVKQGQEGMRLLGSMLHPAISAFIASPDGYETFLGRTADGKRMNAMGKAFEKMGYGEGTLWRKEISYDGTDRYIFNRNLLVSAFEATGLQRIVSASDKLDEAKTRLEDGELTGLIRWMTGIDYQRVSLSEVDYMRVRRLDRALKEEATRRGLMRDFEVQQLDTPSRRYRERSERKQRQRLFGY
jgi:hypothetical protein